jgi:hypothetical protein
VKKLVFTEFSKATARYGEQKIGDWSDWVRQFSEIAVLGRPSDGVGVGDESKEALDMGKQLRNLILPGMLAPDTPRAQKNVREIHALNVDLDDYTWSELAPLFKRIEPYEFLMWTTHKHGSDIAEGKPRLRVLLPMLEPLLIPENGLSVWRSFWKRWNAFTLGLTDPNTKDASRLLYLCSTFDIKHAQVVHNSGKWISVNDVLGSGLPDMAALDVNEADLAEKIIKQIRKVSKDDPNKESFMALLEGRSVKTDRDEGGHTAVLRVTMALARMNQGLTESVFNHLFEKTLRVMDGQEDPSQGLNAAWRAYEGAVEKVLEQRVEYAVQAQLTSGGFDEQYSVDELKVIAERQACTIEQLKNRWVVQKDTSTWYLNEQGSYAGPHSKDERDLVSHKYLARVPNLLLYNITEKGGRTEKSFTQLFRECGTVVGHVVSDLTKQITTLSSDQITLYDAVRPLRELQPKFDAEIDNWLKVLAGPNYGKLVDWLSICMDLSQPLCAIYFAGAPGSGKTLFAQGVAKLFTEGPAGDMEKALGNFNDEAVRCPVLFADEKLEAPFKKSVRSEIRKMLGNPARTLDIKYRSKTELRGEVRILLAANNSDMLKDSGNFSRQDMEAVAIRVLYIVAPQEATAMIKSLPKATKMAWGRCGIAQHARWLQANHVIENPGDRFMVEGDVTQMNRVLLSSGEVSAKVCHWLCMYLEDPVKYETLNASDPHLWRKDGRFFVRSNGIFKAWSVYYQNVPGGPPDINKIVNAIQNISLPDQVSMRIPGVVTPRKFYEIDIDNLAAWAETHNMTDRQTILEELQQDSNETRHPTSVTSIHGGPVDPTGADY